MLHLTTDVGDLVLTLDQAKELRARLNKYITSSATPKAVAISPKMLAAGTAATWLGIPRRWRQDEVEGIVKRVYTAMRVLEE